MEALIRGDAKLSGCLNSQYGVACKQSSYGITNNNYSMFTTFSTTFATRRAESVCCGLLHSVFSNSYFNLAFYNGESDRETIRVFLTLD